MQSDQLAQIYASQIQAVIEQSLSLHRLEEWPRHILEVVARSVEHYRPVGLEQEAQMLNQLISYGFIGQRRLCLLSGEDAIELSLCPDCFPSDELGLTFDDLIDGSACSQRSYSLGPDVWILAQTLIQSFEYFGRKYFGQSRSQQRMVQIPWDLYEWYCSDLELTHRQHIL